MKFHIFICLYLLIHLKSAAQSGWQYLPGAPDNVGRIDDVFFLDEQNGWCANSTGQIHKTTDGGETWTKVYQTSDYFRCIEFYDKNIGYAGTLNYKFLRTTDGGQTWTNLAPSISPAPPAVCGISIVDSLVAYAVGEWDSPGFVLKTTDGGITWENHPMGSFASALVDVFFMSRDTGFVTGKSPQGKAIILYTTDGGETWTKRFQTSQNGQYVWKIQRVTPEHWVASIQTFGGGLFAKSADGGQTWTEHEAPVPDMQGIGFATPLHGWVGGYVSGFYETTDGGSTWNYANFGGNYNRFYFLDSTFAYASGASIYKYQAGASSTYTPPATTLHEDGFDLRVSPNPTNGPLHIAFQLPVRDNIVISLFSAQGAEMRRLYHRRQLAPGTYEVNADIGDLPPGTYMIGVQRNHGLYARQITRQ